MKQRYMCILALLFSSPLLAMATPASDALLEKYKAEGARNFDPASGKKAWIKEVQGNDNEKHACSVCHGTDLSQPGKHHTTQKIIGPMSPRTNAERYTDEKKIEKWFKRNCKDTWGRECSAQEKGDFLKYLLSN